MATPNYGYEKRQRELAKRKKKEEKLKAKAERKISGPADEDDVVSGQGPEGGAGQDNQQESPPAAPLP